MDSSKPRAEAVAIAGEWILAVGTNNEIGDFVRLGQTRVIDGRGNSLVPGFNDAHCHFGPVDLDYIDLRYVSDPRVITEQVRWKVTQARAGELIRGGGWDHELFPGTNWPTRTLLDPVSPNNPVALTRIDGHSTLVNSYVLRKSGITKETPDPPGGEILRDPITEEPTGIFKETARKLLDLTGTPAARTEEEEKSRRRQSWEAAFRLAASLGVTTVQLAGADATVYEELRNARKLTLRVYLNGRLPEKESKLLDYARLSERYPRSDNWIRFGLLKGFADGTLSSATALLFEPFSDDPDKTGLPQMPYEELERRILIADQLGFQIGIHGIGDRANHWILNAYERAIQVNGKRDRRHRIEHASILHPEDIPRFAKLGVIPSTQPVFVRTDSLYAEKRLGLERCKRVYPWRSLLDSGAHVAFGTDYPVEPLDPREGLYAALTRKDRRGRPEKGWVPDQTVQLEEALRCYTVEPAFAEFMEDRKGMIRPGYLADLVLFDTDLVGAAPESLLSAKIDYTVVGGEVVYIRADQSSDAAAGLKRHAARRKGSSVR